ncbi:DNA polymerase IV [Thioalkalivibrio nitratireducens DSM 14787]|uniref:DNA polymerase IV n=2 Tax=Thioalkalivibrio nitratireducens TaxID=186931 RepID=L0DWD0_THIND|nr:DNA polymerase IV [Thioalkalivibrio nitratireducens DSM 14787]
MDAFYASVELLRYPRLRGQPVVIGGRRLQPTAGQARGDPRFRRLCDYAGRGVITTATYEARALGVHSGMGLMTAARLAPDAILLPADFDAYRRYSRLFKTAVAHIAPRIEDRGIDEIYIDLTEMSADTLPLANEIKAAVREATGLSCSIGIAPNKLLAKIASDLDKPDGLTVLAPSDLAARVWLLPVNKINGIGPKAGDRLQGLGIRTIGDLAGAAPALLERHFGARMGGWLIRAAHGLDEQPIVTESEPRSMTRETTFERDLHPRQDRALLTAALTGLCERVAGDLAARGYRGRTIGIKLRYHDFRTLTRDVTLRNPVCRAEDLLASSRECLRRVPLDRRIRLLGVRAGALVADSQEGPAGDRWVQAELPF